VSFLINMLWNPLDFITDFIPVENLDLDDVRRLGDQTSSIARRQGVQISTATSKVVGREVGDDRVDLSRHVFPLVATLMAQEELVHMVTSWPDTSIRKKSWNFCEVTGGPLTDPSQGFDHVRRNGDFTTLGFNDSVVLRIILDVQKGEGQDHSSTQPGKMSMLGSRLATPRRENRGFWMLASIFQDAMLCTHRASEPKYLPPVMGGSGVTPLFDNSNNVFLYVHAYKGGTYQRIYATACSEMQNTCIVSKETYSQRQSCVQDCARSKSTSGVHTTISYLYLKSVVCLTQTLLPLLYMKGRGGRTGFKILKTG